MSTKKRKKAKKSTKRKSGMRGLSAGSRGKRIGLLLTNIVAANLAHEGLSWMDRQDFMQAKPNDKGEMPKVNFKKLGAYGGLSLVAGGASILIGNDYAAEASKAVAVAATIVTKDAAVKPAIGMNGLGATTDDFVDLYRKDDNVKGPGKNPVQLGKSVELAADPLRRKMA